MAEIETARASTRQEQALAIDSRKLEIVIRDTQHVTTRSVITSAIIRNPYAFPVEIVAVSLTHPWLKELLTATSGHDPADKSRDTSPLSKFFGTAKISVNMPFVAMHVAHEGITDENRVIINGDEGSIVNLEQPLDVRRRYVINLGKKSELNYKYDASKKPTDQAEEIRHLPPFSERIASVKWNTGRSLFTTPTRLPIEVEVVFRIEGGIRSQVVSAAIEVRPPVSAFITGALLGSIIGSGARIFQQGQLSFDFLLLSRILVPCLLSIMAVVALSRRSGSQSFVTIEDAFGAFIIGSLIGYGGVQYFDSNFMPKISGVVQPAAN